MIDKIKSSAVTQFILAYVFLASGFIVNFIQICMVPLWYLGRIKDYRKAISLLNFSHWTLVPTLAQWWSNLHVNCYATPETFHLLGKEPAINLMNHRGELDWIVSWIMCDYAEILGNAKCYVKKVIRYVPGVGWSFWMSEFVCLKRSIEHDKKAIDTGLKNLTTFDDNFWMLIFCEGTRFTEEKHKKSVEFAVKKGLQPLKHHLMPRTKGFTIASSELRGKVTCIYDVTVAWKDKVELTLAEMVQGKSCTNSCLIRRIPIEDVPQDEKENSEWLHQIYREKDDLFDFHLKNNRYPTVKEASEMKIQYYQGVECRPIQKRIRNVLMALVWIVVTMHFFIKVCSYVFSSLSVLSLTLFVTSFAVVGGLFYVMMQAGKPQSSYGK